MIDFAKMITERLDNWALDSLKKKHDVNRLWSYSRMSTYKGCPYEYYLAYVKRIKLENRDSCYTVYGSCAHSIIQDHTDGKFSYEEMIVRFNEFVKKYKEEDAPHLRFPNIRNSSPEEQRNKLIGNLEHYFQNTGIPPYNVVNEPFVLYILQGKEKYCVQGYVDQLHMDEDGVYWITDFKTSSDSGFTPAKIVEASKQLLGYALAIHQEYGVPFDKIAIRYDMMKYLNISYSLANGKIETTRAERRNWVEKISGKIMTDFKNIHKGISDCDAKLLKITEKLEKKKMQKTKPSEKVMQKIYDERSNVLTLLEELKYNEYSFDDFDDMISVAIKNNNLDNMPQFIKDKYKVSNCYITLRVSEEIIENFKADMIETLEEIAEKEGQDDLEKAFKRDGIGGDSFYCENLCSYKEHCKYYTMWSLSRDTKYKQDKDKEAKVNFNDLFGNPSGSNNKGLW